MKTTIQINIKNLSGFIFYLRGEKVIFDFTLAQLYQVEVGALKRAVKRNRERFPPDFLFELTRDEYNSLRCQFGILEKGRHSKYLPFAFTEQGVAMLSGVLNSSNAVNVNIALMRAFVQMRRLLDTHKELARKIEELEKSVSSHDEKIQLIFSVIKQLIEKKEEPPLAREPIGYKTTS